jgi:hypothetical protein
MLLTLLGLAAGPALALPCAKSVHFLRIGPPAPALPDSAPGVPGSSLPIAVAMAIKVKDTGAIANKYKTRAGAASQDYAAGVASAAGDWESATAASESNYEQAVQESIARKAFGRGVRGAGSKFAENAKTLGTQRYPTGVANAEGAYARGVAPFLDAIKGIALPPRGPKGSAQNMERANVVAKTLRARKVGA